MLGGGSKKESVENMFENKNTENLTAVIVCSFFNKNKFYKNIL